MPNTPAPCDKCLYLYYDCMYKDDPTYEAECSRFHRPIDGECAHFHEWDAVCKFCKKPINPKEAYLHMGSYVGECCWDERLRMTE